MTSRPGLDWVAVKELKLGYQRMSYSLNSLKGGYIGII